MVDGFQVSLSHKDLVVLAAIYQDKKQSVATASDTFVHHIYKAHYDGFCAALERCGIDTSLLDNIEV